MSRDDITPPLQISTEIVEVDGNRVVVAEVPPAPADRRPVYVTTQGISGVHTLAGLLTYGQFPQQFFPQLMVSVVVHSPDPPSDTRFLDNQTVRGSIPEMVETSLFMLRRNLAVRAVISDLGGRLDEVEYPLEAVREAVVNALLHRDYSPVTRGTPGAG